MNLLSSYLRETSTTQAAFAARVGLTQATVSKLSAGLRGVSLETALKIEAATEGRVPAASWVSDRISVSENQHVKSPTGALSTEGKSCP